jgi:hypothetical protein
MCVERGEGFPNSVRDLRLSADDDLRDLRTLRGIGAPPEQDFLLDWQAVSARIKLI